MSSLTLSTLLLRRPKWQWELGVGAQVVPAENGEQYIYISFGPWILFMGFLEK